MAKDDRQEQESFKDWPKNDPKTEAMLQRWDARVDVVNAVRDWLGR